uniref:Uncharacterized protein n=1 Tax=Salix viminalis TaxID=40686 RepID=A0A6N2KY88_SALVM
MEPCMRGQRRNPVAKVMLKRRGGREIGLQILFYVCFQREGTGGLIEKQRTAPNPVDFILFP